MVLLMQARGNETVFLKSSRNAFPKNFVILVNFRTRGNGGGRWVMTVSGESSGE
jgi:hypothetical protein